MMEDFEATIVPKHYTAIYDAKAIMHLDYVKGKLKTKVLTINDLDYACSQYPEIYAYWKLGILVRDYQHYTLDLMRDNTYLIMDWSRRLGKSTTSKLFLHWSTWNNKHPSVMSGTTWNVILQDQDIANTLYIEPIHEMCEMGNEVVRKNFKGKLGNKWFTDKLVTRRDKFGKVRASQISIKTSTGICRINTLPPTPKAIGREGNILGDEVSKWKYNPKVKDDKIFMDQVIAIIKDNPIFKAFLLSTPEGNDDAFAEAFDPDNLNPDNRFKKIWYPWWVRRDKFWHEEMAKTKGEAVRKGRVHMFEQEYEGKFVAPKNNFFQRPTIEAAKTVNILRTYENKLYCSLGVEWGGTTKSETVICIIGWDGEEHSIRKALYWKRYEVDKDYTVEDDLAELKNRFNIKFVTPDSKGARFLLPKIEKIFGAGRVTKFNFSVDKKTGFEILRQAFVNKTIQIPYDVELEKQLSNFTELLKPASTKGKDDMNDALMMAYYPTHTTKKQRRFGVYRFGKNQGVMNAEK